MLPSGPSGPSGGAKHGGTSFHGTRERGKTHSLGSPYLNSNEWVFGPDDISDDYPRLFHPKWKDNRITSCYGGIQGFLNYIEQGFEKIKINVGNKLLSKHNVAAYMIDQKISFEFSDSNVSAKIDNIVDAQSVASVIDIEANKGYGRIIEMKTDRLSWNILYMEIGKRMGYDKGVTYLTDDPERPYVFSLLIPMEENDEFLTKILFETSREIIGKLERDYTTDLDDSLSFITPHDHIENNISNVPLILEKAID